MCTHTNVFFFFSLLFRVKSLNCTFRCKSPLFQEQICQLFNINEWKQTNAYKTINRFTPYPYSCLRKKRNVRIQDQTGLTFSDSLRRMVEGEEKESICHSPISLYQTIVSQSGQGEADVDEMEYMKKDIVKKKKNSISNI